MIVLLRSRIVEVRLRFIWFRSVLFCFSAVAENRFSSCQLSKIKRVSGGANFANEITLRLMALGNSFAKCLAVAIRLSVSDRTQDCYREKHLVKTVPFPICVYSNPLIHMRSADV